MVNYREINMLGELPRLFRGKESTSQCKRPGYSPWARKIPWREHGSPLQYSYRENSMESGDWWAVVHGGHKVNKQEQIYRGTCSVTQSCPTLCNPWTAARQAPLSFTISQSLLKPMSIELVMPSNYLILCRPLLLLPSIFPNIGVFSNESVLHIRWPK